MASSRSNGGCCTTMSNPDTKRMPPPVALVFCGGGSRGAMGVGFYKAIRELGLPMDLVEVIGAEQVLLTTGRSPNTNGLRLVEAGIRLSDNGGIAVDERMRTSRPGVYATVT